MVLLGQSIPLLVSICAKTTSLQQARATGSVFLELARTHPVMLPTVRAKMNARPGIRHPRAGRLPVALLLPLVSISVRALRQTPGRHAQSQTVGPPRLAITARVPRNAKN